MKKAILLAAVLTVAAAPAFASSMFMRWTQCFGDVNAASSLVFACDDFGSQDAFITYQLDAVASQVVALSGGVDLAIEGSPDLPSFWHMEGSGCNGSGLGISDARSTLCTNAGGIPTFSGSGGATTDAFVTAYLVGPGDFGGANHARILWAVVRAASNPVNLTAVRHFACILNIFDDGAVEAGGSCEGCTAPVAMAANWIVLESPAQAGGEVVTATITSGDLGSDVVTLSNGATGSVVVPTHSRTWGQVKNLFR